MRAESHTAGSARCAALDESFPARAELAHRLTRGALRAGADQAGARA